MWQPWQSLRNRERQRMTDDKHISGNQLLSSLFSLVSPSARDHIVTSCRESGRVAYTFTIDPLVLDQVTHVSVKILFNLLTGRCPSLSC